MFRLVVVTLLAAWAGAFAPSFVRHVSEDEFLQ
jgi:hypothetical protein